MCTRALVAAGPENVGSPSATRHLAAEHLDIGPQTHTPTHPSCGNQSKCERGLFLSGSAIVLYGMSGFSVDGESPVLCGRAASSACCYVSPCDSLDGGGFQVNCDIAIDLASGVRDQAATPESSLFARAKGIELVSSRVGGG
jgi:hypothetical protein